MCRPQQSDGRWLGRPAGEGWSRLLPAVSAASPAAQPPAAALPPGTPTARTPCGVQVSGAWRFLGRSGVCPRQLLGCS
eukprot:COSAG01_NODE_5146_length_4453_cov_10.678916_4_plen_78_part_00